jgi:hypothetical protein
MVSKQKGRKEGNGETEGYYIQNSQNPFSLKNYRWDLSNPVPLGLEQIIF